MINHDDSKGYESCDAPNFEPAYYMSSQSWDSRLYANAYTKFADGARQGSAEWGMNMVQARKTLKTFVQLATTSATTIAAFSRAHQRGLEWLRNHKSVTPTRVRRLRLVTDRKLRLAREREDRRRLSNLIWTLDQVSGTLLAFRYGVLPLMSDLATTAGILSQEYRDEVRLRKSASKPWNGPSGPESEPWLGHESVVLTATVKCTNPNLLLANRLGIINPQLWLWDAMPWSFVLDWWFPIGSFLSNFTASVGLAFVGGSITRTRSFSSKWHVNTAYSFKSCSYNGDRVVHGKRKVRTLGSLPIPLSVPYGSGLGIQRGQNALALCAQLLSKKVKS